MAKRKFLLPILALILIVGSISMVACSDKTTNTDVYNSYLQTIEKFTADTSFLVENNAVYSSKFYFDNFNYKTPTGVKMDDDANYQTLNAIGLNFIEKHYDMTNEIKKASSLKNSVEDLNEAYDLVKVEYDMLSMIDSDATYQIYNGYSTRYKWGAHDFINQVYECAFDLADVIIESGYLDDIEELVADDSQQEEQVDLELWNSKLEFYIDYQNLLVANDFRLLLLESGQGQQFEGNSDYVNISLLLQSFAQTISTASNQLLDDATMAYRNINNMLASERQLMQEALEDFNLYEFIENYGGSVDAYEKEERYAKAYYNELSKYFSAENNFISQYISYIQTNIYS